MISSGFEVSTENEKASFIVKIQPKEQGSDWYNLSNTITNKRIYQKN